MYLPETCFRTGHWTRNKFFMYTASGGFRFALSSQLPQGEGEEMDAAAAGSLSQVPADAELSAFEGKSKKIRH